MKLLPYWLLIAIERVVCCCAIAVCLCLGAAAAVRSRAIHVGAGGK